MYLTKAERETIIVFNEEESMAVVDTCNKSLMNKLDQFCSKSPKCIMRREDKYGKVYEIPKKCVLIRLPMTYSDETRAKMAARAKGLSSYKKAPDQREGS